MSPRAQHITNGEDTTELSHTPDTHLNFASLFEELDSASMAHPLIENAVINHSSDNKYDQATYDYLADAIGINPVSARLIASLVDFTHITKRIDHLRLLGGDPKLHYMVLLLDPTILEAQLSERFGVAIEPNKSDSSSNYAPNPTPLNAEENQSEQDQNDSDPWEMNFF